MNRNVSLPLASTCAIVLMIVSGRMANGQPFENWTRTFPESSHGSGGQTIPIEGMTNGTNSATTGIQVVDVPLEYQLSHASQGLQTIFFDNFENPWPGAWTSYDMNYQNGSDFWSRVTCAPGGAASGTGAAWCTGQGDRPLCGASYDNNMRSWMVAGPFNLSDAVAADVRVKFIDSTESGHDRVAFMFSPDEVNFYGPSHSGTTSGYPGVWQSATFDLSNLPVVGSLLDEPLVWIGILFESDSAQSGFGGAYVDDVELRSQVVNGCVVTQVSPPANAEACFAQSFSWTSSGDCDNLYVAFRTGPGSSDVIAVPGSPTGVTLSTTEWTDINYSIGSGATYEWSVGEVFHQDPISPLEYGPRSHYFQRSPWRQFSVCKPCPSDGACCTPHEGTGCDDGSCCSMVCDVEADCCNTRWFAYCALKASELCGCNLCGNGQCDFDETCATCPEDCSYAGSSADCNNNGVPDGCDIQIETSLDCNHDGTPDECTGSDCPLHDGDAFTTTSDKLWTLDLSTGAESLIGTVTSSVGTIQFMGDMTFDPATGELLVVDSHWICSVNPITAAAINCRSHGLNLIDNRRGLAASRTGQVYLIFDGTTYTIDPGTGLAIALGPSGLTQDNALQFHPDGRLFAIGKIAGSQSLVRLDPATGGVVQVIGSLTFQGSSSPFSAGLGMDFASDGTLYVISSGSDDLFTVSLSDARTARVGDIALTFGSLAIFRDCNQNGVLDGTDLNAATSLDANNDGYPDECTTSICGNGICEASEDKCRCSADCGAPPLSEQVGSTCADGIDNDCDGSKDCAESECFFESICLPPPTRGGPGDILSGATRVDGVTGNLLYQFTSALLQGSIGGMAIGPDGQLYIGASGSRNIVRFDLRRGFAYGEFVASQSGGLGGPKDITFGPDGNLYVADYGNHRVLRYNGTTGAFMNIFVASGSGGLFFARSLSFGPDGRLYVASEQGHEIIQYNGQTGAFIRSFVTPQSGGLVRPYDFTFGPDGNLYATQSDFNGSILRYNGSTGAFINAFVPVAAGLHQPHAVAFGPNGNLYVADDVGTHRFDGQTGALIEQVSDSTGPFLLFEPAQCTSDSQCDDSNPDTADVCFTYACRHLAQRRFYVSAAATGANDGSSWVDAFVDLQSALIASQAQGMPSEVWVAGGIYKPGTTDRLSTFQLFDGLSLLGGFVGTETQSDQRKPDLNLTVLSGDLLGNDGANFTNVSDNTYHVVTASNSGFDAPTLLDGFVVLGGNADGSSAESGNRDRGGAFIAKPGCPTVAGCTFTSNRGKTGGAFYVDDLQSAVSVIGSRFIGNQAMNGGAGGGLFSQINTKLVVANCAFSGNTAPTGGGAYANGRTSWTNCSFTENSAATDGGGLRRGEGSMAIANSIFWENQDAGGMDETAQIFGSVITISNTCVQGWTGALGGSNNTANCDPSFVNSAGRDQSPGTLDDNLRLGESSLNINAGNNAIDIDAFRGGLQSLPAQDLAGYPRILDSVVDRGAYEFFVDCNGNGLPDSQDISGATSADIDENSVPDECPPPVFLQDATGILKTRFISFAPAAGWGADTAIRVKLISLHHVNPPYSGGPSVPFMSFEGESRWVGQPAQYVESTSTGTPLFAASLRCTPYYQDWSTIPLLHVTGSAIVPSSVYEITNVASPCMGIEATCTANSVPLTVNTTRWADVETPYNPPSTTTQPDLGDVAALVNKFKSVPGAPIKARALLAGDDAFGNISPSTLGLDLGFGHIAACVDAFKGKPYPHAIQACP